MVCLFGEVSRRKSTATKIAAAKAASARIPAAWSFDGSFSASSTLVAALAVSVLELDDSCVLVDALGALSRIFASLCSNSSASSTFSDAGGAWFPNAASGPLSETASGLSDARSALGFVFFFVDSSFCHPARFDAASSLTPSFETSVFCVVCVGAFPNPFFEDRFLLEDRFLEEEEDADTMQAKEKRRDDDDCIAEHAEEDRE